MWSIGEHSHFSLLLDIVLHFKNRIMLVESCVLVELCVSLKLFLHSGSSGQKFPSKGMEVSLQATILFPDHYTPLSGTDSDDPFCVGLNTYADVSPVALCVCACA